MDGLSLVVFAGLSGLAVATYVVLRRPGSAPDKYDTGTGKTGFHKPLNITRNSPPERKPTFYASSVKPGLNCCDAVKQLANNRYLLGEEPSLPLPECDKDECRCIMKPQDDRRTHFDRRGDRFSAYGNFQDGIHPRRRQEKGPDRRKK